MKDKNFKSALSILTLDLVREVLQRTGNLSESFNYIAQKIRELSGADTVVLIQHPKPSDANEFKILGISPQRRHHAVESLKNLPESIIKPLKTTVLNVAEQDGEMLKLIDQLKCRLSVLIPFNNVQTQFEGTWLVLGIPNEHHLNSIKEMLDIISGILAIALQNTLLIEKQDKIIKHKTESLLQSEEKYRTVADFAYDWETWIDPDGKYVYVSPACERISGYTAEEYINNPRLMFDITHPEDRDTVSEHFSSCTEEHDVEQIEFRLMNKKGAERWISHLCRPVYDGGRKFAGRRGSNRDITDRKKAEVELKESEEKYRSIVLTTSDGFWMTDINGKLSDVNSAYCSMSGYSKEELLEMEVRQLDSKESDAETADHIQNVMVKDEDFFESVHRRKDGSTFDVEIKTTFLPVSGGKLVTFIRDITTRKQFEANLQQSQKMEAVGKLAGGIAHNFNNILGSIVGYTEVALDDLPEESPAKSSLKEVLKSSHRAATLVKQILAFSRKKPPVQQPFDICLVVNSTLKMLRSTLPATIVINSNLSCSSCTILGDSTQIQQVLLNLCINAEQAMHETGGVIKVSISNTVLDAVEAQKFRNGLQPGTYITVTISDTGSGIDPEIIDNIFEPFFTTKPVGAGTGIGLSEVHGIIRTHKGAITLESVPGEGTSFHLLFPVAENKAVPEIEKSGPLPTGTERILFVDDEKSMAIMAKQSIERLGYKVTVQTDSKEALELFRKQPAGFDLVITDLTMPHMTGEMLTKEIVKIRDDIPVILSTGDLNVKADEKIKNIGIQSLIRKPFERQSIAKIIRDVLDKKQS